MPELYDFAVVGLGAIGSATAAELALRGHSVLGLDRLRPPHTMGSSHSDTRMIREAYYQGSPYLPLVRTAHAAWERLGTDSGRDLVRTTGGLMIGPPHGRTFAGTLDSLAGSGTDYEVLSAAEVVDRFPRLRLEAGTIAVFEPRVSVLALEECMEAMLERAAAAGASLAFGETVTDWSISPTGVIVRSDRGEYRARRLALAVGAWTQSLAPELDLPLEIERTVQYWFQPRPGPVGGSDGRTEGTSRGARDPAWVWELSEGPTWYGFPPTPRGLKVGVHVQAGRRTDVARVDREVAPGEVAGMREVLERYAPSVNGPLAHASVCLYTNTPDQHFVLGRHPRHPEVVVFTGGSGHAFKFALVLGALMADLLSDEPASTDLSHFSIGRF